MMASKPLQSTSHSANVLGDRQRLVSLGEDGELRIWTIELDLEHLSATTKEQRPVTLQLLFQVMRNFNSPNHGSNLQHIKHQAKANLIKSVVTGEPTKLLRRRSNYCKLGNAKSKCSRHIITTCISVVLNNFMENNYL